MVQESFFISTVFSKCKLKIHKRFTGKKGQENIKMIEIRFRPRKDPDPNYFH